jgi:hypothetical protein
VEDEGDDDIGTGAGAAATATADDSSDNASIAGDDADGILDGGGAGSDDDALSTGAIGGARAKKRKTPDDDEPPVPPTESEAKAMIESACHMREYLDSGPDAVRRLIEERSLFCKACRKVVKILGPRFQNNSGNIAQHVASDKHKAAMHQWTGSITRFLTRAAPETPDARKEREALAGEIRALTHAVLTANYVPNVRQAELFASGSLPMRAVTALRDNRESIGTDGTVRADHKKAEVMLKAELCELLGPKPDPLQPEKVLYKAYGAIVSDGATLYGEKEVAILFVSPFLDNPLLLTLINPQGAYDATASISDIQASCDFYGIDIPTQVVCFMGDNVYLNNSIAEGLGVDRARCVPHSKNLQVKQGAALIRGLLALTQMLSKLIHAGGSNARIKEAAKPPFELDIKRITVYGNRFASLIPAIKFCLNNFEKVRNFVLTASSMKEKEIDENADDETVPVGTLNLVKDAYRNSAQAEATLFVADALLSPIADGIPVFSSDSTPSPDAFDNILKIRNVLAKYKEDPSILTRQFNKPIPAEKQIKEDIVAAADAAIKVHDLYITKALEYARRRKQYDPRVEPIAPAVALASAEAAGVATETLSAGFMVDYESYVAERAALVAKGDEAAFANPASFWRLRLGKWKDLAPVALYWLAFPTSALAAERSFAQMRHLVNATRASMTGENVSRQVAFVVNKAVLSRLLTDKLDALDKLTRKG